MILNSNTQRHSQPEVETFEKHPHFVIPAKAEIQKVLKGLDSRLRGNDNLDHMWRN